VAPNRWVGEEQRHATLLGRLQALVENCGAAFALPGGAGTLTEITLMWNLLLTGALPNRPLILIGSGWQEIFHRFFQVFDEYVPAPQRQWLDFAPDVDRGFQLLTRKLIAENTKRRSA